jgi:hypothetical protein
MTPIIWDQAEQKDHNMMPHPQEIGFEVDFKPLKVVIAVAIILAIVLIIIAAAAGEVPAYEALQ